MISMEITTVNRGFDFLSSYNIHPESERVRLSVWNGILVVDLSGEDAIILMEQIREATRFFKGINHGFRKKEAGFHHNLPLGKDRCVLGWTMYLRLHSSYNHFDFLRAVKNSLSPTQRCFYSHSEITCYQLLSPSLYVFNVIDLNDQLPEFPNISIPGSVLDHDVYEKLFGDYNDEYGINFRDDSGTRARQDHHPPHVPEVRIDMPTFRSRLRAIMEHYDGGSVHQDPSLFCDQDQDHEYKTHLENCLSNYDPMKIMFGTLTAVAGQIVGGLAANRLTSSSTAASSWPGMAVELATLLGLSVAMAGMILRGKRNRQALSALMIKFGAMTIASTIIFSMGLHLSPRIAWIVGPFAFLIMAVAAAFA